MIQAEIGSRTNGANSSQYMSFAGTADFLADGFLGMIHLKMLKLNFGKYCSIKFFKKPLAFKNLMLNNGE